MNEPSPMIVVRACRELPDWIVRMTSSTDKEYGFKDSVYSIENFRYKASSLYKAADAQQCPVESYDLRRHNCAEIRWSEMMDVSDMVHHVRRVLVADLSKPILLGPRGECLDGYHRIVKALACGIEEITCRRLKKMPEPDEIVPEA